MSLMECIQLLKNYCNGHNRNVGILLRHLFHSLDDENVVTIYLSKLNFPRNVITKEEKKYVGSLMSARASQLLER